MMQQIALGGAMIALPIFLQMVLEYNAMQTGLSLAPLSLSMFGMTMLAAKKAGDRRPSSIIRMGFALLTIGMVALIPIVPRADSGWYFVVPLIVAGSGFGLLVSQLNNYTLAPISEERISEAAGVNSAAGSFGLSFGLAFAGAVMLATLSFLFTSMAEDSDGAPAGRPATGRRGVGGRRRADEQHPARPAARRRTRGDPGRDHPHQHRRAAARAAVRPARADPRRPHRVDQLVPHDAAAGDDPHRPPSKGWRWADSRPASAPDASVAAGHHALGPTRTFG